MIDEIIEALKTIDNRVLYGIARADDTNTWDCLLVRKERIEKSSECKLDDKRYLSVRIIREDNIPEGLEQKVIGCMKSEGWRRSDTDIHYEYTVDANEVVVEVCKIEFFKLFRGCTL